MTTKEEASDRRKAVLGAIVEDYVASCIPVASGRLLERHDLGVSSATVRKDMARLEDEGLVIQPHLSAGRIPSHSGYRLFVEQLLPSTDLRGPEKWTIRSAFRVAPFDVEELLQLATAVLANFLGNVAFVTLPASGTVTLRSCAVIPHEPGVVRMVAELHGAPPQDCIINGLATDEPEKLEMYGREISDLLAGKNVSEIEEFPAPRARFKCEILLVLVSTMREIERRRYGDVHYVGLGNMIRQPEFHEVSLVQRGIELLEDGGLVAILGPDAESAEDVAVYIGDETTELLMDYSAVMGTYESVDGRGFIGVLGPARMTYRKTIGAVRQVTETVAGVAAAGAA